MDLSFESKRVRSLCENSNKAKRELGEELARKLQARLAEIEAAEQLGDILVLLDLLDLTQPGDVLIPLAPGVTLTVAPYLKASGRGVESTIDLKEVTRVRIKGVDISNG